MAEERVQKILAQVGYGSRRSNEELILSGRVKVNGQLAVLGTKADPQRDTITVDNQAIPKPQKPVYIALHKPQGVLSEVSDQETRQTVRDLVPVAGHLFIVGRLDMESEGLILLTNDGDLTNRLTHPRYGHEKEYRVLVGSRPDERQMEAWRHGIVLEDGYRTAPAQMRVESVSGKNIWMRVILREGRKRQIREMGRQTGVFVMRIQRVRIGTLLLGDLKPGEWRDLRPDEIRELKVNKAYREHRPVREKRSSMDVDRPSTEDSRSPRNIGQPAQNTDRPSRNTERPVRKTSRPARKTDQPARSTDQPARKTDRPARKTDQPARSTERPSRKTDRSSGKANRPARKTSRPPRGSSSNKSPRAKKG